MLEANALERGRWVDNVGRPVRATAGSRYEQDATQFGGSRLANEKARIDAAILAMVAAGCSEGRVCTRAQGCIEDDVGSFCVSMLQGPEKVMLKISEVGSETSRGGGKEPKKVSSFSHPFSPSSQVSTFLSLPLFHHSPFVIATMSVNRLLTRSFASSLRTATLGNRLAALRLTPVLGNRYASSASPNSFPQLPPGFEKLAHSPSALSAISNLVEVMKQNGVDLHTGEKPSMWQMVKLARNQEVRDATTKGKLVPH